MLMDLDKVPKWFLYVGLAIACLMLIPPVLVARSWVRTSTTPKYHPMRDMDNQPRFKAQQTNPLFADGRSMRPPVPGTIARGDLREDTHFYDGIVNGQYATVFPTFEYSKIGEKRPFVINESLINRGQQRFDIFCLPCHGIDGRGGGKVAVRAAEREEPSWVPPASLIDEQYRARTHGQIFNTITNGTRTMPSYAAQISPRDRWAIVAYVRVLQQSQGVTADSLPPALRKELDQPRQ